MNALETLLEKNDENITDIEAALKLLATDYEMPQTAKAASEEYYRLRAQLESLRLALKFYANGDNWQRQSDGYSPVAADSGAKARIALSALRDFETPKEREERRRQSIIELGFGQYV